jgi:hypothetical protein
MLGLSVRVVATVNHSQVKHLPALPWPAAGGGSSSAGGGAGAAAAATHWPAQTKLGQVPIQHHNQDSRQAANANSSRDISYLRTHCNLVLTSSISSHLSSIIYLFQIHVNAEILTNLSTIATGRIQHRHRGFHPALRLIIAF